MGSHLRTREQLRQSAPNTHHPHRAMHRSPHGASVTSGGLTPSKPWPLPESRRTPPPHPGYPAWLRTSRSSCGLYSDASPVVGGTPATGAVRRPARSSIASGVGATSSARSTGRRPTTRIGRSGCAAAPARSGAMLSCRMRMRRSSIARSPPRARSSSERPLASTVNGWSSSWTPSSPRSSATSSIRPGSYADRARAMDQASRTPRKPVLPVVESGVSALRAETR